jgi:hypothetical protein
MMTRDDIWRELGWTAAMVRWLLGGPDGQETRYRYYTYCLYRRERVMAVATQAYVINDEGAFLGHWNSSKLARPMRTAVIP